MLKEYDYNKYFDLADGARSIEFEGYSGRFNPDEYDYFVYDVKKQKDNQVSFKFFFDGSLGQWSGGAHYLLEIKFIGSILCDEVKEFRQEDCKTEKTIFKIKKELFSKDKIIQIENEEVGDQWQNAQFDQSRSGNRGPDDIAGRSRQPHA